MKRFRGGLVFQTHRLLYHSTLGLRAINKKKRSDAKSVVASEPALGLRVFLRVGGRVVAM